MNPLIRYEQARHAIRVAHQVDEVKNVRDKALAMAAYARQANDTELIQKATEIKLRAERRCGELLAETERNGGGRPYVAEKNEELTPHLGSGVILDKPKTLAETGISERQSSDFQAIAAVPEKEFEAAIATGKATTKSIAAASPKRKAKPTSGKKVHTPVPFPPPDTVPKAQYDELVEQYNALMENRNDLADELAAVESLRTDQHVIRLKQLQQELRACKTRRDELMAQNNEMIREIKSLRRRLEKK